MAVRFMVELTRDGQAVERRIVGHLAGDRLLTQDADFALRSRATMAGRFLHGQDSGLLADWGATAYPTY